MGALIIFPPGWDVTTAGPYIAGPLIVGYLRGVHQSAHFLDLNIEVANKFGKKIDAQSVRRACESASEASLDDTYFLAEDEVNRVALAWGGGWSLREGFQFSDCDSGDPRSVLAASEREAPYSAWALGRISELVLDHDPMIIGFTITVPSQLVAAFHLARQLRALYPNRLIVAGGNMVTRLITEMSLPEVFDCFDALIRFSGEETLLQLLRALETNSNWRDVPNIVFYDNQTVVANVNRHPKPHQFSLPSFTDVDKDAYWGFTYLPAIISRGCYYGKCTFCAIPYTWGPEGFLGNDDPQRIAKAVMDDADSAGVTRRKFIEESLHPSMVRRMSEAFLTQGQRVTWEGYARLDAPWFEGDLLGRAARAGLKKLYVGLELIQGAGRNAMNKKDIARPAEFLRRCADVGVLVHLFCMVGFPGSTADEALDTVAFLLDNRCRIDTLDMVGFEYAKHTIVPGIRRRPTHRDWALTTSFEPERPDIMAPDEIEFLSKNLEDLLYDENKKWLHPIYRMYSPWASVA